MIAKAQPKTEKPKVMTGSTGGLVEHDVVCEKGRGDHERWAGNMLYRFLVNENKESYNDFTPMERSQIIGKIIGTIKSKGGWFVQHDESQSKWDRLSEEKVRKKVSDDLRREVRRRREKRSSCTVFSTKLKALKEKEKKGEGTQDILRPVEDPRETDVLFGPGARRHQGNKTYWELMKQNLNQYIISPYGARSMISRSIVQGIRDQNGRFLEQDPKTSVWYEISDKRAIEKTSHALSNKKYKTRKKNTDEPATPMLGFKTLTEPEGSCNEESTSGNSSQENQDTANKPSPSKAGSSKKARLLQRMDDTHYDGVMLLASLSSKKPLAPSTPPRSQKHMVTPVVSESIIITPHDSRTTVSDVSEDSRGDLHEYEEREAVHLMPKGGPPVLDAPYMHEYIYHKHAGRETDPLVAPRYSRFAEEDPYPHEHLLYKSPPPSPYHLHGRNYPPPHTYSRRFTGRVVAELPSPRHHPEAVEYHLASPKVGTPRSRYHAISPRRVPLKPASSVYWANDFASPRARPVEEYSAWR